MNAIAISGWAPGAKLVSKSTKRTGDYHGQMNWELFRKWFTEMPNFPHLGKCPHYLDIYQYSPIAVKNT